MSALRHLLISHPTKIERGLKNTNIKVGLSTTVHGSGASEMEGVEWSGEMVLLIRAIGSWAMLMDKVLLLIVLEIYMRDPFSCPWLMVNLESSLILWAIYMLDNGNSIRSMGKGRKFGSHQTQYMMDLMFKVSERVMVLLL
jgi:hypothetical protein